MKEKFRLQKENQLKKKENQLEKFTDEEIVIELKQKGLLCFGTKQEKLERLKKHYGYKKNNNIVKIKF